MSFPRRLTLLATLTLLAAAVALGAALMALNGSSGSGAAGLQGDADCDDDVDSVDALFDLRRVAALGPFAGCVQTAGDTDCSGAIESADALRILRHTAALPALPVPSGCPAVGDPLTGAPSPAAATPAPPYTPFPPFTVTPSPSPFATTTPGGAPSPGAYVLTRVMTNVSFDRMVDLVPIPGKPDEAIVLLQKEAQIWRVSLSSAFTPALYGDLSAYAGGNGNEEGLLTAAFSPHFESDHRIYIYYTQDGNSGLPTVLARFPVNGNIIDTGQRTVILEVPDFAENHNGGKLLFGPDAYLYLTTGDGGGGGDPEGNGQNKNTLLGKVLRLDVTGHDTYSIPPDNPFVNAPGADEVWAYGLRNPWRASFDRATGHLWVGDVGQNDWEEVDRIVKGGNYGWRCYEGFAEYDTSGCSPGGFEWPRTVYGHYQGAAVTGGYVYRGSAMPELYGWYVYADAYSGRVWAVDAAPRATSDPLPLLHDSGKQIVSFAETPAGELFVLSFDNAIYRLEHE